MAFDLTCYTYTRLLLRFYEILFSKRTDIDRFIRLSFECERFSPLHKYIVETITNVFFILKASKLSLIMKSCLFCRGEFS